MTDKESETPRQTRATGPSALGLRDALMLLGGAGGMLMADALFSGNYPLVAGMFLLSGALGACGMFVRRSHD